MNESARPIWRETAEVIGVLGVVGSLIFVALEIRQNTSAVRSAAVQSIAEQVIDWQTTFAQDDDWIRIITFLLEEGGTYGDLTPHDRMKYQYVVNATIRIMENRYRQVQLGVIDPAELDVSGGRANIRWYRSRHLLDYWQSTDPTDIWSPDFMEFMETEVLGLREAAATDDR